MEILCHAACRICALRELAGRCRRQCRLSHAAYGSPEVSSQGRRAATFEQPRSTIVVATEFMYFLDNNFVGYALLPLLLPATNYSGRTRAAVVLIYGPILLRDQARFIWCNNITFALRTRVHPCISSDDSFTVAT